MVFSVSLSLCILDVHVSLSISLCPPLSLSLSISLSLSLTLFYCLSVSSISQYMCTLISHTTLKINSFSCSDFKKNPCVHVCQQVMVHYKVSSKSGKLFLFQPSFICIMPDSSITFCATLVYWSTENHSTISWPRAWSWVSRSVLSQLENTSGKSKLTFQVPSTVYALFT